ncbi:MAG: alpha/beta hydrolase [Gammaproteobacteria bacterium]|nr:alpha/beta hydrolase [Gammaproteobacteria bacterium]
MATFEDRWVTTGDGLKLYARDYPNDSAPFTVLCLHGLTRNSADFEDLAQVLARHYRVVVMDQRGRGRSDNDPTPANYHLGTYVADTLTLLDALKVDDAALIGTSMGGLMSMVLGSTAPQRFRGMVLNDIGPVVEAAGLERIRGYVGRGGSAAGWDEAVEQIRANNAAAFPNLSDQEWLAFARRLYRERSPGELEPAYDPAIAEPMNADTTAAVPGDLWELFDTLADMPMLVLRGELSDILSAETVAEMARRKPGLQYLEIPQRGHAPLLSEAPAVRGIEDFLREL